MKKRAAMTLAVLALVAGIFPAGRAIADDQTVADPDDVAGPIDVERLVQGHYFEYVLYRIVSFERWPTEALADGEMVLEFDTDDDPESERRVVLEFRGGGGSQMRSLVYDAAGEVIGRAVHRRPTGRSVEIWVKRWMLGHPTSYSVFATVRTAASEVCPEGCVDRVPDEGSITHRLQPLCSHQEATILGTPGNDTIEATSKDDVIIGRAGDDVITGLSDRDVVCGGDGDDVIEGGRGNLVVFGGRGDDHIQGSGPRPTPCNDTGGGAAGCALPQALFIGGAGRDTLIGGRYREHLYGGPGADELRGHRYDDALEGGDGDDLLVGGRGEDWLRGNQGVDTCREGENVRTCERRG